MKTKTLLLLVLLCGTLHAQPNADKSLHSLPPKATLRQVFPLFVWIPFLP